MAKPKSTSDDNVSIEQLKKWKRGKLDPVEEKPMTIYFDHGYPRVNISKAFFQRAYEKVFICEFRLVAIDPNTNLIFQELKLEDPRKKKSSSARPNGKV